MEKSLLTLSLALFAAGFILATPPNSATSTDSARNHASIGQLNCDAPVLDGVANESIWELIDAVPIDRKFTGENPSLYSATWKAFWNDTAIFVLIQVSDDSFFPDWLEPEKAAEDWADDRVYLYFDLNGIKPDGEGPTLGNGVYKGHYQIKHSYDPNALMGKIQPGEVDSTWEANTWEYANPANLTTEWCVSFKALKDSNNVQFDPMTKSQIGFDVYIIDKDSLTSASYSRQIWSNIAYPDGVPNDDWNNMDSAGILTFFQCADCCGLPVSEISSQQPAVTPTLASDYINVISAITRIEIIDIMGRTVMQADNTNGIIDISELNRGIFYVRLYSNKDFIGNQRIIKY